MYWNQLVSQKKRAKNGPLRRSSSCEWQRGAFNAAWRLEMGSQRSALIVWCRRTADDLIFLSRLALRGHHHVGGLHFQVGEHAAGALPVHYFDEVHQIPFGVGKRRRYARRVVARLGVERHFGGLVVLVLGGVAIAEADPLHAGGGGHLRRNFQAGGNRQQTGGRRGGHHRAFTQVPVT